MVQKIVEQETTKQRQQGYRGARHKIAVRIIQVAEEFYTT